MVPAISLLSKTLPFFTKYFGFGNKGQDFIHNGGQSSPIPQNVEKKMRAQLPHEVFFERDFYELGVSDGQNYGTSEYYAARKQTLFEAFHMSRTESIKTLTRLIIREETISANAGEFENRLKSESGANLKSYRDSQLKLEEQASIKIDDFQNDFAKALADYRCGYIAGRHKKDAREAQYEANGLGIFNN